MTFNEHLANTVQQFGEVDVFFEAGMFSTVTRLEQIVRIFEEAKVPFEVVGGVAVNAHIAALHRGEMFNTRDVDLLMHRSDLPRLTEVAQTYGYFAKKIMGGYMLILPGQSVGQAIHLLFVGENCKSTQVVPHPDLRPEMIDLVGVLIPVAPFADLLQMKLSSFRLKDRVHIAIFDDVDVITPEMEQELPEVLRERLQQARRESAAEKPDIEG